MFDIGGWEFLVIILIAIVVIGPKDLPAAIRTISGLVRRARAMAHDFQNGLSDIAREAGLDSVRDDIKNGLGMEEGETIDGRIRRGLEETVDPDGQVHDAFDLEDDFREMPEDEDQAELDLEGDELRRAAGHDTAGDGAGIGPSDAAEDAENTAEETPPKPAADAGGGRA